LEQLSSHWSYGSQSAKDAWQKAHPNQAQPPQKIVQNNSGDNKPSALENGHNVAFALFQIWLSVWDQALFTQTHPVDTKSLDLNFIYNTLEKKYRHLNKIDDLGVKDTSLWDFSYTQDTHPAQDPGYYFAYIISFLYAADIFSMFEQNPFDSAVGGRFRETLLSHGAATDDFEGQIDAFLGRQVDKSKYYATLGA
jgi:metallopeptidase MepB